MAWNFSDLPLVSMHHLKGDELDCRSTTTRSRSSAAEVQRRVQSKQLLQSMAAAWINVRVPLTDSSCLDPWAGGWSKIVQVCKQNHHSMPHQVYQRQEFSGSWIFPWKCCAFLRLSFLKPLICNSQILMNEGKASIPFCSLNFDWKKVVLHKEFWLHN